jgi:hypothetical protein
VRTKRGKGSGAAAKADGQKVDTEDHPAELLGRDAEAASCDLAITDGEERSVSPLMMRVRVPLPQWNYETDHNINPSVI